MNDQQVSLTVHEVSHITLGNQPLQPHPCISLHWSMQSLNRSENFCQINENLCQLARSNSQAPMDSGRHFSYVPDCPKINPLLAANYYIRDFMMCFCLKNIILDFAQLDNYFFDDRVLDTDMTRILPSICRVYLNSPCGELFIN